MNLFWILKVLWIFLVKSQMRLVLGVIFMYFRVFLNVNVQNGYIVLCCKKSKYFLGCLIFLIYFG